MLEGVYLGKNSNATINDGTFTGVRYALYLADIAEKVYIEWGT